MGAREQPLCLQSGGHAGNQGFTLVEILVAISVLAISLVVILQLFSGGLKSSRVSDEYSRAIFHAKERMEEILLADTVEIGSWEGDFEDEYRWKAEVERLVPIDEDAPELPFDVFNIHVNVAWGPDEHERHFEIDTMQIGEKVEEE